ncbi:MAG: BatA and WFA domain-containing protein, partial [Planctomycetota bacterium]|nr:BatA and WFA domain-containing protein [Planctomycetota bacterium]
MTFLNPLMLLGLAGLTVPIVLHLIARHRFPVQNFPSLRLLRVERRTNVFAWSLIDRWQLLLRLLVLALLVFAMGRLFAAWLPAASAPQNLVLVLDASASMRCRTAERGGVSLLEIARDQAKSLLAAPPSACRAAVVAVGDKLRTLTTLGEENAKSIAALADVEAGEGSGPGLIRGIAEACRMLRGRCEARSQIMVFTDLRASALAVRHQEDLRLIAEIYREQGAAWD